MKTSLKLQDIRLMLYLGYFEEERAFLQPVSIDLEIDFAQSPIACDSDELAETHCYDHLISSMRVFCENKTFKLIEYLAKQLYAHVKMHLSQEDKLTLTVKKLNVPVDELHGPAVFVCGDG